jgi:hypothetical protein
MERGLFADIEETHGHEEKLRQESMALIASDPKLSRRLEMIQKGYGADLRIHDRAYVALRR